MSGSNILFILSGSIAGYKACEAISRLVQNGHRVRTVASAAAGQFVGPATLEGLTGEPVRGEVFAAGRAMDHIQLARWADATVICPATAQTLNRLAAGLADDLVGLLFLTHERTKPFLVAPAMNPAMWGHPATRAAVAKLQDWGVQFIPVGRGRTACGEVGEGRMAEADAVVAAVEAAVARPARRLRILVTSGGTVEPIDAVRGLGNFSTGRTGAGLAGHFFRRGHDVLLVRARNSAAAPPLCEEEAFTTFAELDGVLGRRLGGEDFDVVVHAAAVGDFRVAGVRAEGLERKPGVGKLESGRPLLLELEPNPKLVDGLISRSRNPDLRVVAFKLTQGAGPEEAPAAAAELAARAGACLVVQNDLVRRGESPDDFPAEIYGRDGLQTARCATRAELAENLERLLGLEMTRLKP
jgi:phosphopantothenoylcysteine decarboxylase/phosphopantothenate--cysteine ligase